MMWFLWGRWLPWSRQCLGLVPMSWKGHLEFFHRKQEAQREKLCGSRMNPIFKWMLWSAEQTALHSSESKSIIWVQISMYFKNSGSGEKFGFHLRFLKFCWNSTRTRWHSYQETWGRQHDKEGLQINIAVMGSNSQPSTILHRMNISSFCYTNSHFT